MPGGVVEETGGGDVLERTGTAAPAVTTAGLTRRFGIVTELSGVDFIMPAVSILGLLGPNGSGKTTFAEHPDRVHFRLIPCLNLFTLDHSNPVGTRAIQLRKSYVVTKESAPGRQQLA